jgi:hypothetical protein
MPLNEYEPGTAFPGLIGRTTEESSPAWPRPLRAAVGSPRMPSEFESAAGPLDRWPLGRGFERFYGFLGGDTSRRRPGEPRRPAGPALPPQLPGSGG